jgi:hypothetical protein
LTDLGWIVAVEKLIVTFHEERAREIIDKTRGVSLGVEVKRII